METVLLEPAPTRASPRVQQAPHHFAFVDALRGYAIVAVVLFHCGGKVGASMGLPHDITEYGMFGVQLFFVISAFTLFWSLRTRIAVDREPFRAFFVRRLFRIAPLFWTGVLFYLWWPGHWRIAYAPRGIGWAHVLATVLFIHGWYPTTVDSVVPGGWSIAAEAMFYLCVPLLYQRIKSLHAAMWAVLLAMMIASAGPLVAGLIAAHFPADWANLINLFVYYSFPSQLPVFCLGFVLYFILLANVEHRQAFEGISGRGRIALLLCAGAFFTMVGIPIHVRFAIAFVAIAWGLATRPVPLIVNRAIRFVGQVSYSIYLWHFWVLDRVGPHVLRSVHPFHEGASWEQMNGLVQFVAISIVALSITLVVSWASFHLIELPGQRVGKKLIDWLEWGSAGHHNPLWIVRAKPGLKSDARSPKSERNPKLQIPIC